MPFPGSDGSRKSLGERENKRLKVFGGRPPWVLSVGERKRGEGGTGGGSQFVIVFTREGADPRGRGGGETMSPLKILQRGRKGKKGRTSSLSKMKGHPQERGTTRPYCCRVPGGVKKGEKRYVMESNRCKKPWPKGEKGKTTTRPLAGKGKKKGGKAPPPRVLETIKREGKDGACWANPIMIKRIKEVGGVYPPRHPGGRGK